MEDEGEWICYDVEKRKEDSMKQAFSLFHKTKFYRSVADIKDLPKDLKSQVLLAGKSNVGKSSLINRLCQQKNLAKTSSSAGKTRLLNFFSVADKFYLVDLPGYGFSKGSYAQQLDFASLTDDYLHTESPIHLILHVMDARHLPSKDDIQMMAWLEARDCPYIILLNKSDKLSRAQRDKQKRVIREHIKTKRSEMGLQEELPEILSVSAMDGSGLNDLANLILAKLDENP